VKADKIIKNAKIFTSDKNKLNATFFAIKDVKFVMPSIIELLTKEDLDSVCNDSEIVIQLFQ